MGGNKNKKLLTAIVTNI